MENKKISALGYGFVIISPEKFEQWRKNKNIKAKKVISYFSKDNDFFYYCITEGVLIPIHHINYDRYTLLFSIGKCEKSKLNGWEIQAEWNGFNLQVGASNEIWAVGIDEMEKWNIKNLDQESGYIKGFYYDINDNEHIEYKAIRYNIPSNKYEVKIYGLARKIKNKNGMENYGFLFELTQVQILTSKTDPSETDFSKLFE